MVASPAIRSAEPPDAFDTVLASARSLPFAEQARLIMALLPSVLPAVEAARQGDVTPTPSGTTESLQALIARWEAAPEDSDPLWDEIWSNLGIEVPEETR
jgi:hypothetical protein